MSKTTFFMSCFAPELFEIALFEGLKWILALSKIAPFEPFQTCIKGKQWPQWEADLAHTMPH